MNRADAYAAIPIAELDILGDARNGYIAGNAMLAVMAERLAGAREGGDRGDGLAEAAEVARDDQVAELKAPATDLAGVILRLAFAVHLTGDHRDDADARHARDLVAGALADVVLLREAELRRRSLLRAGRTSL